MNLKIGGLAREMVLGANENKIKGRGNTFRYNASDGGGGLKID